MEKLKPRVLFREYVNRENLFSFIEASPPEYDAHKLHSRKRNGSFELFSEEKNTPISQSIYLQLIIEEKEDGIYKAGEMAYENAYETFLIKLKDIENEKEERIFILGYVISKNETFYKKVSELARKCFKKEKI